MITLECHYCGRSFERNKSQHNNNLKRGRKHIGCSPQCITELCRKHITKDRICQQCGNTFVFKSSKQKFCSSSCSATYTNTHRPTRTYYCSDCQVEVPRTRKRCADCRASYVEQKSNDVYSAITLSEVRTKYGQNSYHAKIRSHARSVYSRSGRVMQCENCGYSLHVDICHIKDVKDFDPNTSVSEVNHIDNLIALDKRCHWEFDHGDITLDDILSHVNW